MKKFLEEFKAFAMRGNMIELAVGIIIGGAFTSIVTSLVEDIVNPIIGIFTGNIDFSNLFIALDGNTYSSLSAAEAADANVLMYGSFISNLINFIIMAFVVFMMVKALNKLSSPLKHEEAPAAPTTKICPFCKSEIGIEAVRCGHCTSVLDVTAYEAALQTQEEPAKIEAKA